MSFRLSAEMAFPAYPALIFFEVKCQNTCNLWVNLGKKRNVPPGINEFSGSIRFHCFTAASFLTSLFGSPVNLVYTRTPQQLVQRDVVLFLVIIFKISSALKGHYFQSWDSFFNGLLLNIELKY